MTSKARQVLFSVKSDFTSLFTSLTICILTYFSFFTDIARLPASSFPDRSIGIAVVSGVDANLRTLHYCLIVFFSVILIFALIVLFSWVNRLVTRLTNRIYLQAEHSIQFVLSIFSVFLVFYAIVRGDLFIMKIAGVLLIFIAFLYYLILLKTAVFRKAPAIYRYYKDYSSLTLSLILSFALIFAGWALWGIPLAFTKAHVFFYFMFNVVFITTYPLLLQWIGLSPGKVKAPNLLATIPLALIPAMLPVSNEMQYALSGIVKIQPQEFAGLIIGLLFLLSVLFYVLFLFKPRPVNVSSFVRSFLFPVIIIGFYMCLEVDGFVKFKTFDLFHNGERMLVTQQLFSFGRIPFIDIIPTHGIMDFFGQALYSAVNGYRGPEMFLWQWIPVLAGILLMYFMLARLISPVFSFLLILVTPEVFIFNDYYTLCLVIPLVFLWVINRPNLTRYLVLWLSIVLLFFWRYDFGVIAIVTSFCLVPGVYFVKSNDALTYSSMLRAFKPAVIAFVIVFSVSLLLYSLILLLNGQNPVEMLGQFYIYFKSQAPTQSLVDVFNSYNLYFLLEYIVSPMISILYIVFYLNSLIFRKVDFKAPQILLAWLAIFAVIMTMRTIQRHTILEGFNPVLSIFLLCTIPVYFSHTSKWVSHAVFIFTFLIYTMLLANMQKRVYVRINPVNLIPKDQLYNFFSFPNKASRVTISDSSQFKNFKKFCDAQLKSDQTFFDFSNAPLLYVFTNRMFPAHLIPNLFQAADPIEDYLIKRLDTYLKGGKMPLVLFKQNTGWDSIDGVPQPVRSYRVAEFIYRNYIPFAKIDNYEIWKSKLSHLNEEKPNVISPVFRKHPGNKVQEVEVRDFTADSITMRTYGSDPQIYNVLDLGKGLPLDSSIVYTLSLSCKSSLPGTLQVFYSVNGSPFSEKRRVSFLVNGGNAKTLQSVILPKFNTGSVLTDLRFDPPSGADFYLFKPVITAAFFLPVDRTDPQIFNLRKLPFVWANFDEKKASARTEILEDHLIKDTSLGSMESKSIAIGADFDKNDGNYLHLFISAKDSGQVLISYGNYYTSTIQFDLEPTGKTEQYLVRVSMQWAWMNDRIDKITVRSSVPVIFSRMVIRKGD